MNIEEQEKVLKNLYSNDTASLFNQKKNLNTLIAFGEHQSYLKFTLLIWKERILKEDEN